MLQRDQVLVNFTGRMNVILLLKLCWLILKDGYVSVVFQGAVETDPQAEIEA